MRSAPRSFVLCAFLTFFATTGSAVAGSSGKSSVPSSHVSTVPAHGAAAPSSYDTPLTPDEIWAKLQIGNRRFVQGRPMRHEFPDERTELANGQHPWVIVLGCSDSRVSPELVFDQSLGDLFVIRTVGNIADPTTLGSVEYAIEHLHPAALVVLGHEKCGAVAAAASGEKMPTANLDAIVSKIRPALKGLENIVTGEELVERCVEENVRHCATDLLGDSSIVREQVEARALTILKAVYDLDTGEVTRLD